MTIEKPVRTPLAQRLADFRRGPLAVLVWLAAVYALLVLSDRMGPPDFVGLATLLQYDLAATRAGEVEAVNVVLYEDVERDEVLVRLDPASVLARIDTAQGELARLSAELAAESARSATELRRFAIDEDGLQLKLLQLRAQLQGDRIERERLALLMQRGKELLNQRIGSEADYHDIRLRHRRTVETITQNEVLLTQTEAAYEAAGLRRREWEEQVSPADPGTTLLSPLSRAIEVQRSRIEEIHHERRALALRAPADGKVVAIFKRPGEVVLPGEAVLTLADPRAGDIVVFVPEGASGTLGSGQEVDVARVSSASVTRTVVTSVSPVVERMPERLWRDPVRPEYGHRVLVRRPRTCQAAPGELVNIRLGKRLSVGQLPTALGIRDKAMVLAVHNDRGASAKATQ